MLKEQTPVKVALKQPRTLAEFAKISGVGERKLDQYGHDFTALIRAFHA